MAKVFVGIPTWNRPQYVVQTVRSVLDQTMQDVTRIVHDNYDRFVEEKLVEQIRFQSPPEHWRATQH